MGLKRRDPEQRLRDTVEKIHGLRASLQSSPLWAQFLGLWSSMVPAGLLQQGRDGRGRLRCLGVGSVSGALGPQSQLAFALELAQGVLGIPAQRVLMQDPAFDEEDVRLLEGEMGATVVAMGSQEEGEEEEGEEDEEDEVLFMPHCPSALYEHVLQGFWQGRRHQLVLVGNTLSTYALRKSDKVLREQHPWLHQTLPLLREQELDCRGFPPCPEAFAEISVCVVERPAANRKEGEES